MGKMLEDNPAIKAGEREGRLEPVEKEAETRKESNLQKGTEAGEMDLSQKPVNPHDKSYLKRTLPVIFIGLVLLLIAGFFISRMLNTITIAGEEFKRSDTR